MRRGALFPIVLALAASVLGACEPPGDRYLDEVFDSHTVTRDLTYGRATDEHGAHEVLKLDLYQPQGDTLARRPAIVWVHGGGFTRGDKTNGSLVALATEYARRGYVTVSINYRVREGEYFDDPADPVLQAAIRDAQHDAQAAVRWLRANASRYRVDARRIAAGGRSAGAFTALEVGYSSHDPGSSDGGRAPSSSYPSSVGATVSLAGAATLDDIGPGDAPTIMFHGTRDERVPIQYARATCDTARAEGLVCELHERAVGHGIPQTEPTYRQISDFLYRMLDLGS